jgi:hypothetical protein
MEYFDPKAGWHGLVLLDIYKMVSLRHSDGWIANVRYIVCRMCVKAGGAQRFVVAQIAIEESL